MRDEHQLDDYTLLKNKLQKFIASYYQQRWIKGSLKLLLVFICLYLITTTLEYNLYLSPTIRKFLFFFFLLGFLALLYLWIMRPVIQYFQHRSRLDDKQAAQIIGHHFPEVKDKLLNVLYLGEMNDTFASQELIQASIRQKSQSLLWVRFNDAIDWARNRKLAKYLIFPVVICLLLLIFIPKLFTDSTHRLLHYNQVFAPKAPFDFILLNKNLTVPQFESLSLQAKLEGKVLPEELNLFYQGVKYPMAKNENDIFDFTLKNIEASSKFRLESAGFISEEYSIDIVPRPIISSFEVNVIPPSYTGIKPFNLKNTGDIQAPEGSTAIWKFKTEHIDQIRLKFRDKWLNAEKYSNGYGIKASLLHSGNYTVLTQNNNSSIIDSQQYNLSLTTDAYPTISINEFNDSINEIKYYAGDVADDYGISNLYFVISYNGKTEKYRISIPAGRNSSFHFSTQKLFDKYPRGADINYYFEVYDNDGVHGPKSSRSSTFSIKKLSEKELEKVVDNNATQIRNDISKSLQDAKQFQKDLEQVKKKMLEKDKLDFNDKKLIEDLLKKQEDLQNKLENSKDDIKRNFDKKNEINKQEQSLLDQQKQLEEIIEQMKNPELKDLLQKLNELLEKQDKKELLQNINQMDNKSEKMEKNFDRLLQLYKNLDYKQKLNDMIDKLDVMSKEQEKLALETEQEKDTKEKQKGLNEEMKETQKKMEELNKLNNEVNKTDKKEMEEVKKDLDEAASEQEAAEKNMQNGNPKSGSEKQKKAAEEIKQAKEKLEKLKKKQKKKQKAEDGKMMRRLLENVIYLSFEQEKILDKTKTTPKESPSYLKLIQSQQKLKEDFKLVEDTLYKIASRQVKIRKFIFEEADKITNNTDLSIKRLVDRRSDLAISNEQFAMSAYNQLGLMLSESLKKMQEEDEDENSPGSDQQCDNPKSGKKKKPSISLEKLGEMQQQLNEQMEKLQQQMKDKGKDGKSPSGQKPNENGQNGAQGQTSNQKQQDAKEAAEFAKIAAQQQAIRNLLKKMEEQANQPDKSGKKPFGNELKDAMDKMNQTEKDLVNKRFYDEMMKRQREIQIKLLESAKAEREQDEETRRESERAKNIRPEMPLELKQYLEKKKQNETQIHRTPVGLTPYFKTLSEKYYQLIK
ncbi:MAG: hypothetical protein JNL75_01450 [Chitinophagales bacterium]|nr:hypothetical protein [Chitinophagales bacterium]